MGISANIFSKCAPAIGTTIDSCGTVTRCDVIAAETGDLEGIFTDRAGGYKDMGSLLRTQFEMKACGARQNALYDFLMANAKAKGSLITKRQIDKGPALIEPFILGLQKSVINSEYWAFENGQANGAYWQIDVRSREGIETNVRWFVPRSRVYLNGLSVGGSTIRTAYRVVTAALATYAGNSVVRLTLVSENENSNLAAAKLGDPTSGFLVRGVSNVSNYEAWCYNRVALNPNKHVPVWYETSRWAMCVTEQYREWLEYLFENNAYFKAFGDVPLAEQNRQYYEMWQREWVNSAFWNKALENQTLASWKDLETINTASAEDLYLYTEGECIEKRANAVGIYEQLADCGRIIDLLGQTLNLVELFDLLYAIYRARSDQGIPADEIDIMMSSSYAALFQQAMVRYFNDQSDSTARMELGTKSPLGFRFDSYKLIFPSGVKLNIITHPFFDDIQSVATANSVDRAGNMLWIIDWTSIYPAVFGSKSVVHTTGDVKDLAKVNATFACVIDHPTREVKLNSQTWGMVVQCGVTSAILEGVGFGIPDHTGKSGDYTDYYS
jgi:hypothetical protein